MAQIGKYYFRIIDSSRILDDSRFVCTGKSNAIRFNG